MVAFITAPLDLEKKCVRSEPPPPKLILTGALDLAKFAFSLDIGRLFLEIRLI